MSNYIVIDYGERQNVVRTSLTHSVIASCATFLFLPHFDVICDLLLNRRTGTWNLFIKKTNDRPHLQCRAFLNYSFKKKGKRVIEPGDGEAYFS